MDKSDLLFYSAYEDFYSMADVSKSFKAFCKDAFGEDFSQDGFSDINQIDMILQYIPTGRDVNILDIGCGNGKMLGYLQSHTSANIYGFDFSEQAIRTAKELFPVKSDFRVGMIGEIDYPENKFDVITSMDSMYFADDMVGFVSQIKGWLKENGVFFAGYQEGDVMPKTESYKTAVITKALEENKMKYTVQDITGQVYDMLNKKRNAAIAHKADFEKEGYQKWYDLLLLQTECAADPYEVFEKNMARYIYVARK